MFLIAPAAVAAISAIPAVIKGISGLVQQSKARKAGRVKRPTFVRAGELEQLISIERQRATGVGLPGEAQTREQLEADVATVIREAAKSGDPNTFIQAVSTATAQKSKAEQNLAIAAAQEFQTRQDRLIKALKLGAGAAEKEFDINQFQPFLASAAASSALRQAGLTNIQTGIEGITGAVIKGQTLENIAGQ